MMHALGAGMLPLKLTVWAEAPGEKGMAAKTQAAVIRARRPVIDLRILSGLPPWTVFKPDDL